MAAFTQTELRIIDALATGKSAKKLAEESNLSEAKIQESIEDLKNRLDAETQADLPGRFAAVTGWSSRPKDYA